MTQTVRQNKLFAAEDYAAVYESYVNANFQAYDFDTIRTSMVNYVRENYPENYNDWVESAEFVALLDVIAQFGHNLAYRLDMNTRNNFLSTAERQDSVLKLAEFLGYQPKRNLAASGHIKITSVKTTEPVIGADGKSLGGKEVRFETTDADNLDDFITVMNAIFNDNNQFGSPMRQVIADGITTQFYDCNNLSDQIFFDVTGLVLGSNKSFNVTSLSYDNDNKRVVEKMPDPHGAISLVYKNDGKGIASAKTGFFFGFKQGAMQFKDVSVDSPIDNMTIDVNVEDINQTDVWVQTINSNGDVVTEWTRVNDIYGNNAIYNTIASGNRNVYSVKTRTNNQISVMFPDNSFGNIPNGIVRIWYRTSENNAYVVRPDDIGNPSISIKYYGADNSINTATFGIKLKESISNASASESMDSIKTNAPRIYATQNRMITAQDYSSYLLSQSENILKIKSINRTHSGHSRYVMPNDPTGSYANLEIYSSDFDIQKVIKQTSQEVNSSVGAAFIVDEYIATALRDAETVNAFYEAYHDNFESILADSYPDYGPGKKCVWTGAKTQGSITTGFFVNEETGSDVVVGIGESGVGYISEADVGSLIKFNNNGEIIWAKVSNIYNGGFGVNNTLGQPTGKRSLVAGSPGAIALDAEVPEGSTVELIYKAMPRVIESEIDLYIRELILEEEKFNIWYNIAESKWDVTKFLEPIPGDVSQMMTVDFSEDVVIVTRYSVRIHLFADSVTFNNISNEYELDEESKKKGRDVITVITDYSTEYKFYVYGYERDENGDFISNVIRLVMEDNNGDNRPDVPDLLNVLFDANLDKVIDSPITATNTTGFKWKHFPADNEIIDPSFTNIIDVYTLTKEYDTNYRAWLSDATGTIAKPLPPTINELNTRFGQVNDKKAMSDKIVYRPVKYLPLFGTKADSSYRATFRVVKVPGANVTDNELKNRILTAVQDFFDINNWDFGETFYFTELAAYVHKQLPGIVGSFVIVPVDASSVFGDLFQIRLSSDELFIPDIDVNNIQIIDSITHENIKAG